MNIIESCNQPYSITYPQIYIQGDPIVNLYMEKVEAHTNPFVLFVQMNNPLNSKLYPIETFSIIQDYLNLFHITFEDVEIYLEYTATDSPSSSQFIQLWNFTRYKDIYVSDIMFPYPIDDLPAKVKSVRQNYLGQVKENVG